MNNRLCFPDIVSFLFLVIFTIRIAVAAEPQSDARVLVKEIRITGTEAIRPAELQHIVAPYIGKESDLADLRKAADSITEEYRRRGYNLARAIVPEQDLSRGTVELRVLEGRVGKLTVQGNTFFSTSLIEG